MKRLFMLLMLLAGFSTLMGSGAPAFNNSWKIIPTMSPQMNRYTQNMGLEIAVDGDQVTVIYNFGRRRGRLDTLQLTVGEKPNLVPLKSSSRMTTHYSGVHAIPGEMNQITASWADDGRTLVLDQKFPAEVAQGTKMLREKHTLTVSKNQDFLTYTIKRESRIDEGKYVFKVKNSLHANVMYMDDNWEVQGDLQRQAMLISLQGIVNRDGANLYLIYPETWQFTYSQRLYEWYRDDRGYTFTTLKTPAEALAAYKDQVKGYVVWDKNVRTSLTVAYTVAGLEDAVVVSEDQVAMLDSLGFKKVADFRGKFTDMNDTEIYAWAKDQYWDQCSRKFLIWLGGHAGKVMKPGVADWGVSQRAFFQDLSTNPEDTTEIELAKELLGDMQSDGLIMGWHSYAKDRESQHVTLCSSFGLPVLGLHNNPNISFENQIGFSEGFVFKNNHHIEPGKKYIPKKKVYMACIQTDGIGIGAWLKPGRGEIPYAWETLMNYSWLTPSLLEFFYSTATANDYFIGALSGPGYMYPKAVPADKLPGLLQRADSMMKKLDLHVFDIMDYSLHGPRNEFADLTKDVIDAYYENMPDAIGFVNGYVPANTYYHEDGRPLISFEYYLSPTVSEEEAAADLMELGELNDQRPYYLLLHIRETSGVARVKSILNRLPEDYELLPLDIFLKMAGEKPGFENRYIER